MKKLLSFILGVCLILPCAFLFTGCKDKPEAKMETWDGTTLEVSAADTNGLILIETAEELAGLAKAVNEGNNFEGKTIRLTCDMDMANKAWTPIGIGNRSNLAEAKAFSGTFDGNGKKIIGLTNGNYDPSDYTNKETQIKDIDLYTYSYGLFGFVVDATIKGLEVTVNFDCNETNLKGDSVGGIVGFASGKLTMENCVVNGTVDGGFDSVGGVVGRSYNSTSEKQVSIKNCINNANVTADYKAAGVLGYVYSKFGMNLVVDGCVNNGEISSIGTKIDTAKDSRYTSIVSGVVVYGLKNDAADTFVISKNINNGILRATNALVDENTREQLHHYNYIATKVGQAFNELKHNYDFGADTTEDTERENKNFGTMYYLNEVVETEIVRPLVDGTDNYNGTTNMGQ